MDIHFECNLKAPIIQLEAGKFSNDSQKSLAVLSPNKLSLFEIDEANMAFKIVEEFTFKRVAYNFCIGNFGRTSDREYICVQSTDTTLSFYVNGHLSFSCFLSDCLLPSPINYLAIDDSIVIVNSNRYFQAYKYKSLAVLNSKNTELTTMKTEKRATADWSFNIGEDALEIKICDTADQSSFVVILCRYSVFILHGRNRTAIKKRFDCRCRLLSCFGIDPRFILTNSANELMVFHGTTLKWKAQIVTRNVIDIAIGSFNSLNGFVVTLSDTGDLSILYLGTDPSTDSVMLPSNRDAANNDDELARLQRRINTITNGNGNSNTVSAPVVKATSSQESLKIRIDQSSAAVVNGEYSISVTLRSGPSELRNIAVRIGTHRPIAARQKSFHFATLRPQSDVTCRLAFLSTAAMVAVDLRASIFVTFDNDGVAAGGVCQVRLRLPLALVVSRCAPSKHAQFKVTLDSVDSDVAPLGRLFPDLAADVGGGGGEQNENVAIAFRYHSDGPVVTILTSVAAKRYRIQSDHFEAIWLVMSEFCERLGRHFGGNQAAATVVKDNDGGCQGRLKLSEPLPLDAYFLVLDFHYAVRTGLAELERLLEERSRQLRAIEKLFLTRAKDKSISTGGGGGIDNIESLLENSLEQLLQLADLVAEQQQHQAIVDNALCAATSTIGHLLQIAAPRDQRALLRHALASDAVGGGIGLEEVYEQVVAFLLKSAAAAGAGGGTGGGGRLAVVPLVMPVKGGVDKLKKHVTMLCERVLQGVSMLRGIGGEGQSGDGAMFGDGDMAGERLKTFVTSPRTANKTKKKKKKHQLREEPIME